MQSKSLIVGKSASIGARGPEEARNTGKRAKYANTKQTVVVSVTVGM